MNFCGCAYAAVLGLMLLCPETASAQARPPATPVAENSQDPVEMIRKAYSDHFTQLPPSRKCGPTDAKGYWKEDTIYESDTKETEAQQAQGPRYLLFSPEYNQIVWARTKANVNPKGLPDFVSKSKSQYIMTTAGMLYIYRDGAVASTLICSVATAKTNKHEAGMLMLALPIEKDKSLTVSLYAPFK